MLLAVMGEEKGAKKESGEGVFIISFGSFNYNILDILYKIRRHLVERTCIMCLVGCGGGRPPNV